MEKVKEHLITSPQWTFNRHVCSCYTRKVLDQIMIILIFILHVAYAFQPLDVTCLGPLKRK